AHGIRPEQSEDERAPGGLVHGMGLDTADAVDDLERGRGRTRGRDALPGPLLDELDGRRALGGAAGVLGVEPDAGAVLGGPWEQAERHRGLLGADSRSEAV